MADIADYGKIIVLTGAGASAALGLPTMASFRQLIAETNDLSMMADGMGLPEEHADLEAVYDRLQLYEEFGHAGLSDANLQEFIVPEHERQKRRIAAFGGRYPVTDEQRRFQHFLAMARHAKGELERMILDTWGLVDPLRAEQVYGALFGRLLAAQGQRLTVFTTNYDLTFEHLSTSFPEGTLVNGLRQDPAYRWVWDARLYGSPQESARLVVYRLHGCSHWFIEPNGDIVHYPRPPHGQAGVRPMVIFPSRAKTDQLHGGPFAVAYRAFREALTQARLCVIIGYSFRDVGIQEALASAPSGLLFTVVDPNLDTEMIRKAVADHPLLHFKGHFGLSWVGTRVRMSAEEALLGEFKPGIDSGPTVTVEDAGDATEEMRETGSDSY